MPGLGKKIWSPYKLTTPSWNAIITTSEFWLTRLKLKFENNFELNWNVSDKQKLDQDQSITNALGDHDGLRC